VPTPQSLFQTRGFRLHHWQQEAVDSWVRGDDGGPYRGTLEIFTGGGKTLIALSAAARAAQKSDSFTLVIVVPTIALAHQWTDAVTRYTNVRRAQIARVSASKPISASPNARAFVAVINTAAKLGRSLRLSDDTMLVVDECHRAGAPTFRSALEIPARFRLGLSATPEREELDEDGEPLRFDEQVVAKRLGRVVFSFDLADARRIGWLPEYRIVHHGLSLTPEEQSEYERRSRRVDDLGNGLRKLGIEPARAWALQTKAGEAGEAARAYLAVVGSRKDLLYRAQERTRLACKLIGEALVDPKNRIIVFNERIEGAIELFSRIGKMDSPSDPVHASVALEHSKLPAAQRKRAILDFRSGRVRVLISAKSLIEGIDVPAANVGLSVASTGSVRQRIQALGRVLRRYDDGSAAKRAEMHLLYIAGTVDEAIYGKEDWGDLTGDSRNEYLRWSLDPTAPPILLSGPPRSPKPTEDQEHDRLAALGFPFPTAWLGVLHGQEYHVDTQDNVANAFGTYIANPQGVGAMIRRVRGMPGGKFVVTPRFRFVLVSVRSGDETIWRVAGKLDEPFVPRTQESAEPDGSNARPEPGAPYLGPQNEDHGRYRVRSRGGGTIVRRVDCNVSQFALLDGDRDVQAQNGRNLLKAWRDHVSEGIDFFVNDRWDAWYRTGGVPRFLAHVPQGFMWPDGGSK
jgi:superfamily II DNA or RNA helicase